MSRIGENGDLIVQVLRTNKDILFSVAFGAGGGSVAYWSGGWAGVVGGSAGWILLMVLSAVVEQKIQEKRVRSAVYAEDTNESKEI